jgi:flagellar basal-body rod protein FlgC
MNLFGVMDISASALQAERVRAEVVAANMANSETTRTADGGPYQRHHVVFQAAGDGSFEDVLGAQVGLTPTASGSKSSPSSLWLRQLVGGLVGGSQPPAGGVAVTGVIEDASAPLKRYEPGHPDADAEGFVAYPDINPLTEMVDLMGATRSYGMNASAVQAEKTMVSSSFEILK